MSFERWQLNLLDLLKGNNVNIIPVKDVDSVLFFLNKFDADRDLLAAKCIQINGSEAKTKEKILKLIDRTLLEDERDIFRIFGQESFSDKSRKTLKVRYQRLCRVFHPDHGFAEQQFLNQRMSVINSSYDLAEKNFDNPLGVHGGKPKHNKSFTSAPVVKSKHGRNSIKYSQSRSKRRRRRRSKGFLRRFRRKAIKKLYGIDDFLRGPSSNLKKSLRVIVGLLILVLGMSAYQFISSGTEYWNLETDLLVSNEPERTVIPQPFEKELQVSEIEKILDEMLKENSTSEVRGILKSPYKENNLMVKDLEINDSTESFKNELEKSYEPSSKLLNDPPKELQKLKVSAPKVVKTETEKVLKKVSLKSVKNIEGHPVSIPKGAKQSLVNLQQFYNKSQTKKFASLFADDGSFLDFYGKTNIKKAMQRLNDKMEHQKIHFEILSMKETRQWLFLYGKMKTEHKLRKTGSSDKIKNIDNIEIILFNTENSGFLVSSIKKITLK